MTIGERIKQAREARNLKRSELARVTEIPYPTLAGIENSDQSSSTRLHVIAKALRVRVEWLETGKGHMDADPEDIGSVSQPLRFDLDMIADACWVLGEAFAAKGRVFRLEDEQERFLQVYLARLNIVDGSAPGNTAKLLALAEGLVDTLGERVEERVDTLPAPGDGKRKMARGIRHQG